MRRNASLCVQSPQGENEEQPKFAFSCRPLQGDGEDEDEE